MEHLEGQNLPMPTTNQLVQVILTLQQKVHSFRSWQADLEAAAATLAMASLAEDTQDIATTGQA